MLAAGLSPSFARRREHVLRGRSTIRGAGATFPFPIYAKWASEYKQATGVEIAYAPVGSGSGVDQIERRLVDFGATDVPLTPAELQRIGVLQFPTVIGGVVPVVNISGIRSEDLNLTVKPGRVAFEAAAMSVGWRSLADLDQLLIDQSGAASWPMIGATFILLPIRPQDASRALEVMKLFDWAMRRGRRSAVDLDYVLLPDSAVELIGKVWAEQVRSPAGDSVWPDSGAPRR